MVDKDRKQRIWEQIQRTATITIEKKKKVTKLDWDEIQRYSPFITVYAVAEITEKALGPSRRR